MTTKEQLPDPVSDRAIERGETYDHAEHGPVTVTGIWQRTRPLDAVHADGARDVIVIRYLPAEDGGWIDELAESLDRFVQATA